jgi:hypothetical protein
MNAELEKRVVQFLKDVKPLLYHWNQQVSNCGDCKKLAEETAPMVAGLNGLLKELSIER